ncbi:MAG: ABC transporter ATP-binding protein [Bacillota bacterium]
MFRLSNVKFKDILYIKELEIKEKETTCIIGKSGGGKTTLLKLLNNMISISEGSIKFKNKEITDYNPIELRREIIMLPQNPVMFPDTIKDNFTKTLEYAEKESLNNKIYVDILKKVDLKHQLDTNTKNLSGGEKQRLALARVLLLQPNILLLDEPSSALDEETEDFIFRMLVDYTKKKNGTLVMITHSKSVADKYGETIVSLDNGKIKNIENGR